MYGLNGLNEQNWIQNDTYDFTHFYEYVSAISMSVVLQGKKNPGKVYNLKKKCSLRY